MSASDKSVSTIILNWQQWRYTLACVESLLALDHKNNRIIICDNDSKDGSVDRICEWADQRLPHLNAQQLISGKATFRFTRADRRPEEQSVHLDRQDRSSSGSNEIVLILVGANRGFAAGNNVGIRYALSHGTCDYVWILNNDTIVHPNALGHLLERMEKDPSIGICGPTLCYMRDREAIQARAGSTFSAWTGRASQIDMGNKISDSFDRDKIEGMLRFVSGAAMLVRREFIENVGFMQEDYFLYYEELDWAQRGRNRYSLGYAPEAIVYHEVGGSIGTSDFGEPSDISLFYLYRNRVRICFRFAKLALPFVFVDDLKDIVRWCLRGQFGRAWIAAKASIGLPR